MTKGGAKISIGCKLPFSLEGKLKAGHYEIGGGVSSQYLSGLLMGLPLLGGDSTVTVTGGLQSKGYVDMTLHALARFGVDVQRQGDCFFIPGGRPYKSPGQLLVEGDFSNGAFFLVMGALLEDGLLVKGLPEGTLQGDRAILTVLEEMGAHVEHTPDGIFVKKKRLCGTVIDARDIPDLVPVLAVAGALAEGKTTFVNAGRLRAKESDRIKTVCKMITDLGGRAEEHAGGLTVWGGLTGGTVFGAGDHRIVMSAAVASAVCPVTIDGAEAVNKSYPIFFDHLLSLGAKVVTE